MNDRSQRGARGPDWLQADVARIDAAVARARALPSGGWYAVCASRGVRKPTAWRVAGRELVLWRTPEGQLRAAPDRCPHMGARLSEGEVDARGRLVCPWHGLRLSDKGTGSAFGGWACVPAYDDGVLAWVRLAEPGQAPSDRPILAPRPARHLDGVIRVEALCEAEDVLANRLDPWHGVHFHPYSFTALEVTDIADDVLHLRVRYKIAGPLGMTSQVTFHCPDPRSIVMTIQDGPGRGSVVETHATPIAPGRTAIVEASLATADVGGFGVAHRWLRPVFRPFIRRAARRLWVDDAAYAERRYALRVRGAWPPGGSEG